MKLYEIVELFEENEQDKTDEQMYQDQKESIIFELKEKITNVIANIQNMKGDIEKINNEVERLQGLKKRADKKLNSINNYILWAMQEIGKKKIDTHLGSISLRKSEQVIIDDETKIPAKFTTIKQTEQVNKTDIKKALKAGEKVEGAYIKINQNLQIK